MIGKFKVMFNNRQLLYFHLNPFIKFDDYMHLNRT